MNKPAFWIWLLAAPVLTGTLIVVLLLIPSIQATLGQWIIGASIMSMLVSIPFAWKVGKVFA
jgi:phosphoglycerol transferase MdoB-like AlkP superfamily enzyme